jgi:hypothetical protein
VQARPSPVPGDLVKLLAPVGHYRPGTPARVIAAPSADVCEVELDDGRRFAVATAALKLAPSSSLGEQATPASAV